MNVSVQFETNLITSFSGNEQTLLNQSKPGKGQNSVELNHVLRAP